MTDGSHGPGGGWPWELPGLNWVFPCPTGCGFMGAPKTRPTQLSLLQTSQGYPQADAKSSWLQEVSSWEGKWVDGGSFRGAFTGILLPDPCLWCGHRDRQVEISFPSPAPCDNIINQFFTLLTREKSSYKPQSSISHHKHGAAGGCSRLQGPSLEGWAAPWAVGAFLLLQGAALGSPGAVPITGYV